MFRETSDSDFDQVGPSNVAAEDSIVEPHHGVPMEATPTPVDVEDHELDSEMARVEAYLLSLRMQKNIRALVSRLPIEVLAYIFSFFPASDDLPHHRVTRPPPWLAVTHVCRRWRETALSFPRLWTHIITTNRFWMTEMLLRSKSAPITIAVDAKPRYPQPSRETALIALSHAGRAVCVEIHCVNINRYIRPLFTVPGTLLERLVLEDISYQGRTITPSSLFLGQTPKLRELQLRRCSIQWPSPFFQSSLIYLAISRIPSAHRPSPAHLRAALAAIPNLQTLDLKHSLAVQAAMSTINSVTSAAAIAPRVCLPCLTDVRLTAASGIDILGFTLGVDIPASACIRIVCEDLELEPMHGSSVPGLVATLSTLYGPKATPGEATEPFQSLRIQYFGGETKAGWQLSAFGRTIACADPRFPLLTATGVVPRLTVQLRWPHPRLNLAEAATFCKEACHVLPLRDVEALAVDCHLFHLPEEWIDAFSRLTRVERLLVRSGAVAGFLLALDSRAHDAGAPTDAHDPASHPRYLFPRLHNLTLARANLEALFVNQDTTIPMHERLHSALKRRWDAGEGVRRLERLGIKDCDLSRVHAAKLAGVITHPEVDWDGNMDGFTVHEATLLVLDEDVEVENAVIDTASE